VFFLSKLFLKKYNPDLNMQRISWIPSFQPEWHYKSIRAHGLFLTRNLSYLFHWSQVFPALLDKKDRGRGADLAVHPKAFGEKVISEGIEGVELLIDGESGSDEDEDDEEHDGSGESDDAMESDGEDGSELVEDEEMDSDVEADHLNEAEISDLEGKSYSILWKMRLSSLS